jgi:hypothetical protein
VKVQVIFKARLQLLLLVKLLHVLAKNSSMIATCVTPLLCFALLLLPWQPDVLSALSSPPVLETYPAEAW